MIHVLIVDASASDNRVMANLLVKAGYGPVVTESIESGKQEAAKLPPGAVIVTAMRLNDGRAIGFIDWLKTSGYNNPVIVILDGYNPHEIYEVLHGHRAVDIVQRKALDKMLIETIRKYEEESLISTPVKTMFPRQSQAYQQLSAKVGKVAKSDMNILIVGEGGVGKEPLSEEIYRQSKRKDKPCIIIDALVLQHQFAEKRTVYDEIKQLLRRAVGGTVISLSFRRHGVIVNHNLGMEDFLVDALVEVVAYRSDEHSLRECGNLACRNKGIHLRVERCRYIMAVDRYGLPLLKHLAETLRKRLGCRAYHLPGRICCRRCSSLAPPPASRSRVPTGRNPESRDTRQPCCFSQWQSDYPDS